jgi:surface polysaccharide O-acyltransferase-like enzyme
MPLKNERIEPINRAVYVDLLRIAATFGVILLHVACAKWYDIPGTSAYWQIMNVYNCLVRWTVPVFVMISGIFHLRPNKQDITFKEETAIIFKKAFKLACALIFWGIVYNAANFCDDHILHNDPFTTFDIIKIPAVIIFGPAWYHLWFLYMLIGLYLLTPILRRLVNACKQEHIEYFLVLFFIVGTCFPLINSILDFLPIFKGKQIYFPANELTGYVGYYIAGYYFTNYKVSEKIKKGIYALAVFSILFTIAGTSLATIYEKKPVNIFHAFLLPNTLFVAYGVFLLFQQLFGKIKFSDKTERIVLKISKNTLGIFLIHMLIIQILDKIGINTLIINPILSIPLISILVFIISQITTMIINKVPVLNKYTI